MVKENWSKMNSIWEISAVDREAVGSRTSYRSMSGFTVLEDSILTCYHALCAAGYDVAGEDEPDEIAARTRDEKTYVPLTLEHFSEDYDLALLRFRDVSKRSKRIRLSKTCVVGTDEPMWCVGTEGTKIGHIRQVHLLHGVTDTIDTNSFAGETYVPVAHQNARDYKVLGDYFKVDDKDYQGENLNMPIIVFKWERDDAGKSGAPLVQGNRVVGLFLGDLDPPTARDHSSGCYALHISVIKEFLNEVKNKRNQMKDQSLMILKEVKGVRKRRSGKDPREEVGASVKMPNKAARKRSGKGT